MSNNDWSDDETETLNIQEQPKRDFPPSDSESEEEYEYNYNKILACSNIENYEAKSKLKNNVVKKKVTKNQPKKIVFDWSKKEEPETTKKKWVSKRMESKKLKEGKVTVTTPKRQFQPRLPVPTKKYKSKANNINIKNFNIENKKEFPKL